MSNKTFDELMIIKKLTEPVIGRSITKEMMLEFIEHENIELTEKDQIKLEEYYNSHNN